MKVYIVHYGSMDTNDDIIRIFSDLQKANNYARRCMSDEWKVQDGYEYTTVENTDGTISYNMRGDFSYYVTSYEVEE